ncbi:MAG: hypothetical protein V2A76_18695 [Planctomycetota bacterium]
MRSLLKVLLLTGVVLGIYSTAASYARWSISAICPKCLQHAYIHEKRVLDVVLLYRSTTLSQRYGGLMSPVVFSPAIPGVDPLTYEKILGSCEHEFKYGGQGVMYGFIVGGLCLDGSEGEWERVQPRLRAIEALYAAYERTGSRESSAAIYGLLDSAFPIDDESRGFLEATKPLRKLARTREESAMETIQKLAEQDSDTGRWARRIIDVTWLAGKLEAVESAGDLEGLKTGFSERLSSDG